MKMSIRIKILLPILALFIALVVIITSISISREHKMLIESMVQRTQNALNMIILQVNSIDQASRTLKDSMKQNYLRIAKAVAVYAAERPENRSTASLQKLAKEIGVDEIHITDGKGVLRYGTIPDFYGFDFNSSDQTKPFLKILNDPSAELAQEPTPRGVDKKLFEYTGVARIDEPGIVQIGVEPTELITLLKRSSVQQIIRDLSVDDHGGYGFVANRNGEITSHPDASMVGKNLGDFQWGKGMVQKLSGSFQYTFKGKKKYMSYKWLGDRIIAATVFIDPYLTPLKQSMLKILLISILGVILAGVLVFIIIQFTANRPLKQVRDRLVDISRGEGDLTQQLEIASKDEIGDLAENFNAFMRKLNGIVNKVKTATADVSEGKDKVSKTAEETVTNVTQITASIEGVQGNMKDLDLEINSVTGAAGELTRKITSLFSQIENQSSAAEESSAAITEMIASINNVAGITQLKHEATKNLVSTTKAGGRKMEATNTAIEKINSNIDSVSQMVKVINNVAAQTNLLAMNASIEAAHAGEYGHGFAVVAAEIRKLAESSSSNAKRITDELKDIMEHIKEAADTSNETNLAFQDVIREVDDVNNAFAEINHSTYELSTGSKQITEAIDFLNDINQKVKENAEKMKQEIEGLYTTAQNANTASTKVTEAVTEINGGIKVINGTADTLRNLTGTLSETAERLNTEINRFRVSEEKAAS